VREPTARRAPAGPLKVGLMVPSNNTTMETELGAWLPPGSAVTTVKIPRGQGLLSKEAIPAYRDSAIALAREHFSDAGLDLIAYGCTAAGFILGPAGDAEFSAMLTEATGLPVVTTARAMVSALQQDEAKRVAVVTPYQDAVNTRLAAFLASVAVVSRMSDCSPRPSYFTSCAWSLISGPASAFDTGQFFLAACACVCKSASVKPGTSACVFNSMRVMVGPSPKCTLAVVAIRVGVKPALVSNAAKNIEKQPACAAPINSSGFVPWPDSKREAYVNGPS